jgi:carboxypeptidase-like protein
LRLAVKYSRTFVGWSTFEQKLLVKLCIVFLFLPLSINAQEISGKVSDTLGTPLSNASVFVSNTSIGTITNKNGDFVIHNTPEGTFDLVISYVGYETLVSKISNHNKSHFLFTLKPKDNDLQNVIIRNYEKNGWERWGFLFTNNFIGTSALADHCKILNPKDIGFVYSEKKRVLAAYSQKPIIIINKKLGYRIEFDLEEFRFDFNSKFMLFEGYPLFIPLDGNKSQQRKWASKRKEVYEGSLLHFMRALHEDKLMQSGFIVRRLIRNPNSEKDRVKHILDSTNDQALIRADSMNYYRQVMKRADFSDILYQQPLRANDFARSIDSNTVLINFADYLHISYVKKKEDPEYYTRNVGIYADSCITAMITLPEQKPITVTSSGNYYDVTDLILLGYWAWSEKIAKMLPFDYWP